LPASPSSCADDLDIEDANNAAEEAEIARQIRRDRKADAADAAQTDQDHRQRFSDLKERHIQGDASGGEEDEAHAAPNMPAFGEGEPKLKPTAKKKRKKKPVAPEGPPPAHIARAARQQRDPYLRPPAHPCTTVGHPNYVPPQQVQVDSNITIVTFTIGWMVAGATYAEDFTELLTGGLQDKAERKDSTVTQQDHFYWLDCRTMNDPGKQPQHCGHCGEHRLILEGIIRSSKMPGIMREIKDWVAEKMAEHVGSMNEYSLGLGYVCTKGTHRSVATGRVIIECLRRDGFSVAEPKHLSQSQWKRKNRCSTCNNCKLDNPAKDDLFNRAYMIWQECQYQ